MPPISRRSIGDNAENIACQYLESRGFQIIDRNWQIKWGEIDIVALYKGDYHFIEVRYRRDEKYWHPLDTFSRKKRFALRRAVYRYIHTKKIHLERIHIDFLGMMPLKNGGHRIWYVQDVPIDE